MISVVLSICAIVAIIFLGICLVQLSKHAADEKKRMTWMNAITWDSTVILTVGVIAILYVYYKYF